MSFPATPAVYPNWLGELITVISHATSLLPLIASASLIDLAGMAMQVELFLESMS